MEPDRWQRITAIFEQALEREGEERLAFVTDACEGDAELLREVEVMLSSHDEAGSFLSASPASPSSPSSSRTPALTAGSRLGPYEVTAKIGEGGMGEVYRARDTRLDRDVALKVLPSAFTDDPERLARFEREAKVMASLSHPNIGSIHGLEEADGVRALVLELVDGATLADRIAEGPVPFDEALTVAKQIAEALETAHDQGVIHRDLKPANVKVGPDGSVKVLDFGLAKAQAGSDAESAGSATITAAATGRGVLIGTAAYMSPEQARGRPVDKRADIWAFGCVLYEMLTGRRAFPGETMSDTLARILERDPAWEELSSDTPSPIRRLLTRCLDKDAKERLRDIGEARVVLRELLDGPPPPLEVHRPSRTAPAGRSVIRWWMATVALACVAGIAGWVFRADRPVEYRDAFTVTLPADVTISRPVALPIALSPDGRDLVLVGEQSGISRLYHRRLDQLEVTPIPGTEGALTVFFSPDGSSVGFVADSVLRRVPLDGGTPETICTLPSVGSFTTGQSWSDDGTIWLGNGNTGLYRVPATGGTPEAVTTVNPQEGERGHFRPHALPGGDAILYTLFRGGERMSVAMFLPETGEHRVLVEDGRRGAFSPTGHIVFGSPLFADQRLWAMPFDLDTLTQAGDPVPLLDGVTSAFLGGDGTLGYLPVSSGPEERRLVWVDRAGNEQLIGAPPRLYNSPRLSPDGSRLAFITEGENWDVWVHDFVRGDQTRVTMEPSTERVILWTPDGRDIVVASNRDGDSHDIYSKSIGSATPMVPLFVDPVRDLYPSSWFDNGRSLATIELALAQQAEFDIGIWRRQDRRRTPLFEEPYAEGYPEVSPDGRWLAYVSYETGQAEVYVTPFPDVTGGSRRKISVDTGTRPRWSPDGRELFYQAAPGCTTAYTWSRCEKTMMAVTFDESAGFAPGQPVPLFHDPYLATIGRHYDLAGSGDDVRFVAVKLTAEHIDQVNLIRRWADELPARVPLP